MPEVSTYSRWTKVRRQFVERDDDGEIVRIGTKTEIVENRAERDKDGALSIVASKLPDLPSQVDEAGYNAALSEVEDRLAKAAEKAAKEASRGRS